MSKTWPEEVQGVTRALFEAQGITPAFDALRDITVCLFGQSRRSGQLTTAAWIAQALKAFGNPKHRQFSETVRYGTWYIWQFIINPERRRHYLKTVRDIKERKRFWAFHRDRIRRTK